MPKELTHWIIAEEAFRALPSDSLLRALLTKHHNSYLAGAVLPDTLLHLFRGPYAKTALKLANDFHDCRGNSFAPLLRAEDQFYGSLREGVLACMLGIIVHIEADIMFHPFVYAHAGKDIGKHYTVETDLDVYLVRNGYVPPARRLDELLTAMVRETVLLTGKFVFDPEQALGQPAFVRALELHSEFQGRYDSLGWKLLASLIGFFPDSSLGQKGRLFYPLLKTDKHWNIFTGSWVHPVAGDVRSDAVMDLLEQTVQRTCSLFGIIEEAGCTIKPLGKHNGENLLTGLHGRCSDEMRWENAVINPIHR